METEFIADAWGACPDELRAAIVEFWDSPDWAIAAAIARKESNFNAFALNDTTDPDHPCGAVIGEQNGVAVSAERSVGYFQINSCNFSSWEWQRFYNARHNAGTAHLLWSERGWAPWYFSATALGLL